jgi:hypothetical protein
MSFLFSDVFYFYGTSWASRVWKKVIHRAFCREMTFSDTGFRVSDVTILTALCFSLQQMPRRRLQPFLSLT